MQVSYWMVADRINDKIIIPFMCSSHVKNETESEHIDYDYSE